LKESIFFEKFEYLKKYEVFDKPFRAKQVIDSIIKNKIFDFQLITNLPKSIRDKLDEHFFILDIFPETNFSSSDGTIKYLFRLNDGEYIESVFLKDKNNRITFCISTQSGCRMGCKFCMTGKMNLIRNLTHSEIISQILFLSGIMYSDKSVVDTAFNIVFMGMGEPLDNFENLTRSIDILIDSSYFNLNISRITVSTCGLIDKIKLLSENYPGLKLAVSLNSANQEKREKIMPVSKSNPVQKLADVLYEIYEKNKNRITLEYVLIENFNMEDSDLKDLEVFNSKAFHINLIPLNCEDEKFKKPSEKKIKYFQEFLEKTGFNVTRRYRRGEDIQADCGQLYWKTINDSN
jgi:23S rRNA (adenine2503-C2)-methyltransferase